MVGEILGSCLPVFPYLTGEKQGKSKLHLQEREVSWLEIEKFSLECRF